MWEVYLKFLEMQNRGVTISYRDRELTSQAGQDICVCSKPQVKRTPSHAEPLLRQDWKGLLSLPCRKKEALLSLSS